MKKYFLLGCFVFCVFEVAFSQVGEWVWLHGPNTINSLGNYGVQGIPSPTNDPPAVYEPCEWTDLNGNFWMFGGGDQSYDPYSALWKYDPLSNEWTWMKGPGTINYAGNFGTQGVPSPANQPPASSQGTTTWVDHQGNLWMFGGVIGNGMNSALWKYDISTNEWTWMKGPNVTNAPGIYGIQTISDIANYPPSRYECASAWTDNLGDLWLFGGIAHVVVNLYAYNDLWRFNIATNTWTWMKGSNVPNQPDIYGIKGIEDPLNTPGGRTSYSHWVDVNGNLWLLGGEHIFTPYNSYNDLWRYNPTTNSWTWINGSNINNPPGNYGTKCISSPTNVPGARHENRVVWTDQFNNFWLFGGALDPGGYNAYNDLWMYCVAENRWIWVSGDNFINPTGNWGTMGASSPTNKPDRRLGGIGWTNRDGYLYFFGGSSYSWVQTHNDIWKFTIDYSCVACSNPPIAQFTASNNLCGEVCTSFLNLSQNATSYQWLFPGAVPGSDTSVNPTNICYSNSGTFDVTLIASNGTTNDTLTFSNYITVYPAALIPTLTQIGDTLFVPQTYTTYQWYHDSIPIPGATNYFYVAPASGNYNIIVTDSNGCSVGAGIINVIADLAPSPAGEGWGEVFPNPNDGSFEIKYYSEKNALATIEIINTLGEIIFKEEKQMKQGKNSLSFGEGWGEALGDGIYLLKISSEEKIFTKKIVIEK